MCKRILIVCDYQGYFHQQLTTQTSLDWKLIAASLCDRGYHVQTCRYHQLASAETFCPLQDTVVIYTSSQLPEYKTFIDSVVYLLATEGAELVPSYQLFRCHNDKVMQELFLRRVGIPRPKSYIFGSTEELRQYAEKLQFPMVLKLPGGFGSCNVFKVTSIGHCVQVLTQAYEDSCQTSRRWTRPLRVVSRLLHPARAFGAQTVIGRFVLQEFVPCAEVDWKVLVFGDHYYALRRKVRPSDFRASGSGLREFARPPDSLLEFAYMCYQRVASPWLSLDIIPTGDSYLLAEFQATHFGPYTQVYAELYYKRDEHGKWHATYKDKSLEEEYVHGIVYYLDRERSAKATRSKRFV